MDKIDINQFSLCLRRTCIDSSVFPFREEESFVHFRIDMEEADEEETAVVAAATAGSETAAQWGNHS